MEKMTVLGGGMKFPPQINPATGRFVVSKDNDSVKESIYLILMTQKTERYLRPEYGSRVLSYTFGDTNSTMLTIMSREIMEDITKNEPRIEDIDVEMDAVSKKGSLLVNITYTVIETQKRENFVFPFYLNNEDEDVSEEYETVEQY